MMCERQKPRNRGCQKEKVSYGILRKLRQAVLIKAGSYISCHAHSESFNQLFFLAAYHYCLIGRDRQAWLMSHSGQSCHCMFFVAGHCTIHLLLAQPSGCDGYQSVQLTALVFAQRNCLLTRPSDIPMKNSRLSN